MASAVKRRKTRSSSWEFFVPEPDRQSAKCKICDIIIRTTHGATSGLQRHLFYRHSIKLKLDNDDDEDDPELPTGIDVNKAVSKFAALDGCSFNFIARSEQLRELFAAGNCKNVPSSPSSIKLMVLSYYEDVVEKSKLELMKHCVEGPGFSLSLDEWTSLAFRRYLNVNLHAADNFWNLGLIRIRGTFTSEACRELIKMRLQDFGLDENNITCIVSDGAAMMKKLGRISSKHQQLCMSHGLHLAVIDTIYKCSPEPLPDDDPTQIESSCNDEDDEENSDFIVDIEVDSLELLPTYEETIKKVRKLVKLFRNSPKKTETLHKYTLESFGNELSLFLDVKTRWNSILDMLERVLKLKKEIKKALAELEESNILNDSDYQIISDLVLALSPVKAAVKMICLREANLVTCDVSLNFMFKKIELIGSEFSSKLHASLMKRVKERRTVMSDLINYLHDNSFNPSESEFNDSVFPMLPRNQLVKELKLFARLVNDYQSMSQDNTSENLPGSSRSVSLLAPEEPGLTLDDELGMMIKRAMSGSKRRSISETSETELAKTIRKEMGLYEDGGNRGKILDGIYSFLLTIPPSSVEAERVFSLANSFSTKFRSRLGDDSLNALVFLKSYFQKCKLEESLEKNL